MDLQGKCVLLGVTGGIAAYKMANVASALKKLGADVEVIMTENATHFITPLVFETLTGHKCMVDTFDRDFKFEVTHISLAKKADVVLVAPATANVIAKMAHGIADDMLTTVVLAARCPKLVSPAMNTGMLENPITQDNLRTLEHYGFTVIPSESGVLACKDVGSGRLPKEDVLIEYILHTIARPKDLAGVRIAVTIPAGIDDGQAVSLRGQGNAGKNGGPAGDLIVGVHIQPHPQFQRDGTTVLYEQPISFYQAAMGAELEIPTIDGKVKYNLPAGTQTGTTFRLRGKGIPELRGRGRGDQYVTVRVAVPTGLNGEQKEALRAFAAAMGEIPAQEEEEGLKGFFDKRKRKK